MKASKLLLGLFALSMLTFTACSSNKDSSAPVRNGYYGGVNGYGGSTYGSSVVQNVNVQSLTQFLSAGSGAQVGTISSVQIAASIGISCSGNQQVIVNGSNGVVLTINDNYSATQGPIQVFMPVTSGQVYNGQMQLTFQDNYGALYIQGTYTPNNTQGMVQGTISSSNSSGPIGSFSMPISSFMRCQ